MPKVIPHLIGFEDIVARARMIRQAENKLRELLESHGFEEIITPIVLPLDILLERFIPLQESWCLFSFLTSWGERATLRWENTNAVCRHFAEHAEEPLPRRYYYIGPMFRNENLHALDHEKGRRFRQFIQCGFEIIGDTNIWGTVEIITISLKILEEFGFEGICRLSDIRLVEGLYKKANLTNEQADMVHHFIGERNKDALEGFLRGISGMKQFTDILLKMTDISGSAEDVIPIAKKLFSRYDHAKGVLNRLDKICSTLKRCGHTNKIVVDLALARYRTLYTGVIFQFDRKNSPECGAGGECSIVVANQGGPPISLVGGGFGLERLLIGRKYDISPRSEVIVRSDKFERALEQSEMLRKKGYRTEIEITGRTFEETRQFARQLAAKLFANGKFVEE